MKGLKKVDNLRCKSLLISNTVSDLEARKFPVKYLQAVIYFEDKRTYYEGLNILYQLLNQVEAQPTPTYTSELHREVLSLFGVFPVENS